MLYNGCLSEGNVFKNTNALIDNRLYTKSTHRLVHGLTFLCSIEHYEDVFLFITAPLVVIRKKCFLSL